MPTFEILEEAVQLALTPTTLAGLPPISDAARSALTAGYRQARAGATESVRLVTADRGLTKQLRDWFIHAEVTLGRSKDPRDRARAEACRDAANALIVAFATGRDLHLKR